MHLVILMLVLVPLPFTAPVTLAQPSSIPPTSLPVTPLSPSPSNPAGIGSCDLCRPLEGRPGSDLQRHRHPRDRDLHPHKKAPGVSKSLKRNFKSQLPHRRLEENQEGSER